MSERIVKQTAIEALTVALDAHDAAYLKEIEKLQNRIEFLERERSLIKLRLAEGQIDLLKNYLMVD